MTSTHAHATQTGDTLVVEPQRFAIVPEWVLDLDVSDAALRLYGTCQPCRVSFLFRSLSRSSSMVLVG